jgi:hypothetical protein
MPSLVADVLARVRPTESRAGWWNKLPPDVLKELNELRDRFHAGELGAMTKTALARAIVEAVTDRGLEIARVKQVIQWLENLPTT